MSSTHAQVELPGGAQRPRAQHDSGRYPHESPRTTKLYDRTNDQISLDELEGFPFGHQWPRNWYQKSATSTSPKFRYGYTLSLEGGNDRFDELATLHPPGKKCGLDTGLFNENPNPDCQQAACW
jgi:hypothetical protein